MYGIVYNEHRIEVLKPSKETAMHVSCRILMLDIKQYPNINSCNNIIANLQATLELGNINLVIKILLFYINYNNY